MPFVPVHKWLKCVYFIHFSPHAPTSTCPVKQKTYFTGEGNHLTVRKCRESILMWKITASSIDLNHYHRFCQHSSAAKPNTQQRSLNCHFGHTCNSPLVHLGRKFCHCKYCKNRVQPLFSFFVYGSWTISISGNLFYSAIFSRTIISSWQQTKNLNSTSSEMQPPWPRS